MTADHGDCRSYCRRCEEEQERALLGQTQRMDPVALLMARVTELESKLSACMVSCDVERAKAREMAIEECAATVEALDGHEDNPYLAPGRCSVSQRDVVLLLRGLKAGA